MTMTGRGWREESTVWTYDTMGRAVPVTTGLTKDREGRLVAVLAVDDGPSTILYSGEGLSEALSDLQKNIAAARTALDETRKPGR